MTLKAPFPWFGGKSLVAPIVWERFGDVAVYAEPFAGSLAVLLGRPPEHERVFESVNDKDGFIVNAWRAIVHDPETTAHYADWPSFENDLHARHAWLVERRANLVERLEGDPDYYDVKIAGWWLWGVSNWLGGRWCGGRGAWSRIEVEPGDWRLRRTKTDRGVARQMMVMNNMGVRRIRVELIEYFATLSERLIRVKVSCGDWSRILSTAALAPKVNGVRGIFLDPPYSSDADRTDGCYAFDDLNVAHVVREWCIKAPREYRIALCGYEGEGHEVLEREHGWSCFAWTSQGGMQRDKTGGNRTRERIWFSPACLSAKQLSLLG
jgi:DNA adenine methylase